MESEVHNIYGHRIRVRACGVLITDNNILMVKHSSLGKNDLWSPPGGGVELGETAPCCLKREFMEETGLSINVDGYLFACEFIRPPLHAIELFFAVSRTDGEVRTGVDPEMGNGHQIIKAVEYLSASDIKAMPKNSLHGIFNHANNPNGILQLKGYLTI